MDKSAKYEVRAKNYGADHVNKIHSDEGAAKYGFAGALVPGVAIYAYLTRPVIDSLGVEWLRRGTMSARFIKPVYHGDQLRIERTGIDEIDLKLFNSSDVLCAAASAGLPAAPQALDSKKYRRSSLPAPEKLRPASIAAIKIGEVFGSLDFNLDLAGEGAAFLDDVIDDSPVYRGSGAFAHPAFWIAKANEIIMRNAALGPWIHTASDVRHYAAAHNGEDLSLRGTVIDAFEKRGHELITMDLGLFGENDRPIAQISHSAIIKLREPE